MPRIGKRDLLIDYMGQRYNSALCLWLQQPPPEDFTYVDNTGEWSIEPSATDDVVIARSRSDVDLDSAIGLGTSFIHEALDVTCSVKHWIVRLEPSQVAFLALHGDYNSRCI